MYLIKKKKTERKSKFFLKFFHKENRFPKRFCNSNLSTRTGMLFYTSTDVRHFRKIKDIFLSWISPITQIEALSHICYVGSILHNPQCTH